MLNDVLFELGCEELPSASVWTLAKALADSVSDGLKKNAIQHGALQIFATPRRLGFLIKAVPEQQPEQTITKRGPAKAAAFDADNKPTSALIGFMRGCGITLEDLSEVQTDKGVWMMYEATKPGRRIHAWLPSMIEEAFATLPIAKPMRWGAGEWEFARPVHWAVLLYGSEILPMSLLGIQTGQHSFGHRFHHPESFIITKPDDYEMQLEQAKVIADFAKRRQIIADQVLNLAASMQATAVIPDDLLDEVTSIVEWPQALPVQFDPSFLQVPQEVLIASMQAHQKCFALKDNAGKLLPRFITIANIESTHKEQVIAGNAKVMHARLSDAAFFFHQDKKETLSSLIPKTEKVIFQKKLGTLKDKACRLKLCMQYLAPKLALNAQEADRAAELSKCDLLTGMVGEFPELQGLMGYYYALHDGESEPVAIALNEQYWPRFAADDLPKTALGKALSLADRLDTLVGIFAIGEKPSGVKDPFKLRRHALAIARMLLNTEEPLELSDLLTKALENYASLNPDQTLIHELKSFILERVQSFYHNQGITADLVHAARARQDENLADMAKRIAALQEFVKTTAAISLSAACKRVNNILQQATCEQGIVKAKLFQEPAEKDLYQHIQRVKLDITPLTEQRDYQAILAKLATLKEPVDAFFDNVMVMVDDPVLRVNRLLLLFELQNLLQGVADIGLLVPA